MPAPLWRLPSRRDAGSNGEGELRLTSSVPASAWFTVGHQRIAGKSYKWMVNSKVVKTINASDLKSPYGIPNHPLRWPIQLETKGTSQTNDVVVLVDWWTIWGLK